jgi:hypothetical protein
VTVPKADYDENIAEAIGGGGGNTLVLVQWILLELLW